MEKKLNFIKKLKGRLKNPLPGKEAHLTMMVKLESNYIKNIPKKKSMPAAVMILLHYRSKNWHFFLTKRTQEVRHHKGQISFPGGIKEKYESLPKTAIRETEEEIGISASDIKLIGSLTPLHVLNSNFLISPYIGYLDINPTLKVQKREVENVFSIPIKKLILDKNQRVKNQKVNGKKAVVPYFHLNDQIVWGATSAILSELKLLILDIK